MSDNNFNVPQKIRTPIRWIIAVISLAALVIAYTDIKFQNELHHAYFRGRPVSTLSADYAIIVVSIYFILVAAFGRWRLFPRGK